MLGIYNSGICVLAVRGMQQQGSRSRHQQSNKRMSWTVADVQKECICDRTFWTSTDALQGAQVVLELGSTQRNAEQELNKKWRTRVMQIKIETGGEIVEEPNANLKKRKLDEPDINPGGSSSLTADTPKRKQSEQGSSANESSLAGCIAAVNNLLCDVPIVDLSRDRTALSGKFPEDELKAGRELELQNMLNFDAFELVTVARAAARATHGGSSTYAMVIHGTRYVFTVQAMQKQRCLSETLGGGGAGSGRRGEREGRRVCVCVVVVVQTRDS